MSSTGCQASYLSVDAYQHVNSIVLASRLLDLSQEMW